MTTVANKMECVSDRKEWQIKSAFNDEMKCCWKSTADIKINIKPFKNVTKHHKNERKKSMQNKPKKNY